MKSRSRHRDFLAFEKRWLGDQEWFLQNSGRWSQAQQPRKASLPLPVAGGLAQPSGPVFQPFTKCFVAPRQWSGLKIQPPDDRSHPRSLPSSCVLPEARHRASTSRLAIMVATQHKAPRFEDGALGHNTKVQGCPELVIAHWEPARGVGPGLNARRPGYASGISQSLHSFQSNTTHPETA